MLGKFTLVPFPAHAKHTVAGECNYTSSAPCHTRKFSRSVVYIGWRRGTWKGISKRKAVLFQTSACCKLNTDNKWQHNTERSQCTVSWSRLYSLTLSLLTPVHKLVPENLILVGNPVLASDSGRV